jgi:hypothetical protein
VLVVGGEGSELVSLDGRRQRVPAGSSELDSGEGPVWLEGSGRVLAAWAPPGPPSS